MSPNIQSTNQALDLLYKVISRTIITNYRTSTPLLRKLTEKKNKGANPDGTQGWFDRFENNTMYLDIVTNPVYATFTQPTAKFAFGIESIQQYAIPAVTLYNSVQYTEFVNQITTSDRGAVTKFAERVIREMSNGFKRSLNRTLWGAVNYNGSPSLNTVTATGPTSNPLAYTASGSTSGTNLVDIQSIDTFNLGASAPAALDRTPIYYLAVGMPISITGATGGTSIPGNVSGTTITNVSYSSGTVGTVQIADSLVFSSGAGIVSISSDGSNVMETQGIQALVQTQDSVIQGVDLSKVATGLAHVQYNTGQFTVGAYSALRNACQLAKPTTEWANQTVYNLMATTVLTNQRTGMGESSYLDIGYESFTAHQGNVEVILDYDVPGGALFGLYLPGFTLGILRDVSFLPMGTIRIPNYAAMEIAMQWVGNLGASLVEPNFAMYGITSAATY
jgi:hypothetical protein